MTTAVQTRPFPQPGEPIENAEQVDALPVGSVMCSTPRNHGTASPHSDWTKQYDGLWTASTVSNPWDSSAFSYTSNLGLISIPEMNRSEITSAPEGTAMWLEPRGGFAGGMGGRYVKQSRGRAPHWVNADGDRRNDFIDTLGVCYRIFTTAEVEQQVDSLTLPNTAVEAGMLVRAGSDAPVMVVEVRNRHDAVVFRPNEYTGGAINFDVFNLNGHSQYALLRQEPLHIALLELANRERQVQAQENERLRLFATRMKSVAEDLEDNDLDELLEEFRDLGMEPGRQQPRDFLVEFDARIRIRKTVTVRDMDEAEEAARDAMGFTVDSEYTIYSEDCTLLSLDHFDTTEE